MVGDEGPSRLLSVAEARMVFRNDPLLVAHAALTARRLGLVASPRAPDLFDVLELFAFVRPAVFCAPSAAGLARAVGLADPPDPPAQAQALRRVAAMLLTELGRAPQPSRGEATAVALTLERAGWAWGPHTVAALTQTPHTPDKRAFRGSGLDVWARLPEWEDEAPTGEAGSRPVTPQASRARLTAVSASGSSISAHQSHSDVFSYII